MYNNNYFSLTKIIPKNLKVAGSRTRIVHDALHIFPYLFHQFGLGDRNAHYLVIADSIDEINIADNFYQLAVIDLRNEDFFIAL